LIAILAALVFAAMVPATRQICALSHLDACGNTDELFSDKTFALKIRKFVGKGAVDYLYQGNFPRQQMEVLGGPPDPPTRIGNLYRFTACRRHSCSEKGAVVFDPSGAIVATAILHSACGKLHRTEDCPHHDTLTVFVKDASGAEPIIEDLSHWAKAEVRSIYTPPGLTPERLDEVEVFAVANGVRTRVSWPR